MYRDTIVCGHLNIVKAGYLLSHQKELSSPDSLLRLLTRKIVSANPNGAVVLKAQLIVDHDLQSMLSRSKQTQRW
jgi:hypothetical protein